MTKALWSMRFPNTSSKRSDRYCDGQRRAAVTRNGDSAKAIQIPDFLHTALFTALHISLISIISPASDQIRRRFSQSNNASCP
jgi:hypothetical protein